ncbi:MAG: dihydropteroate synthase, partial [Bacteroidota bacterium]|nr:dihydropteroate synthase [Bacteroidota bacterium]
MVHALNKIYNFGSVEYDLRSRTFIMGILNITPDSFSDGGKYLHSSNAVDCALQMIDEGADFIDVGGESTRPGSESVSVGEELNRVIPVIEQLVNKTTIPISIDTTKSEVAEKALQSGAVIVNDISSFHFDNRMPAVVSKYNASIVLMHTKDKPKLMQHNPEYKDLIPEIKSYLSVAIKISIENSIKQIIIDPGIGFGKKLE